MTSVTCVTTRYLPNLKHLARLHEADVVVLLDMALLPDRNARSFVNRNCITNPYTGRETWLTVPITRGRGQVMSEVKIAPLEITWPSVHINRIQSYFPKHEVQAPGLLEELAKTFGSHSERLLDFNSVVNRLLLRRLGFPVEIVKESAVLHTHTVDHRLDVAKAIGANMYVAGEVELGAMELNGQLERFRIAGIHVAKSPNASGAGLDERIVKSVSCIEAIFRYGLTEASIMLSKLSDLGKQNINIL